MLKLGYTILYVENVEATLAFYERAFGMKRRFVHESGYGELETGGTTLSFASFNLVDTHGFKYQKVTPNSSIPGMEIGLVTEDVEGLYAMAVASGAVVVKKPSQKPWGQTVAYVRDLNGFLVEICSPVSQT